MMLSVRDLLDKDGTIRHVVSSVCCCCCWTVRQFGSASSRSSLIGKDPAPVTELSAELTFGNKNWKLVISFQIVGYILYFISVSCFNKYLYILLLLLLTFFICSFNLINSFISAHCSFCPGGLLQWKEAKSLKGSVKKLAFCLTDLRSCLRTKFT